MNASEPTQVEVILCMLTFLCLIASWAFRILVFARFGDYPVISEHTQRTSVLSFGDWLSISLFRDRARLPSESRATVLCFIALYWAASLFMALLFASYGARNWI